MGVLAGSLRYGEGRIIMPTRIVSRNAARWLPVAALLLCATAPAAAQEPTGFQKLFGALGLIQLPPEEDIDYRERAPLVVPPSQALIAPRNPEDVRNGNPDWPVDHDVRRKKRDAAAEKETDEEFYGANGSLAGNPVGPSKLNRGRISREEAARRPGAQTAGQEFADGKERLGPEGLGFKGWGNKKETTVVFTGEPERRLLTDPPPGLRTPSANAPYGVVTKGPPPKAVSDRSASPDDPAVNRR
jgi:hypothetical protein